ncbi:MAG: transglycosylase SLT domain-containing protein [Fibrobacter sp.]|nr:transglycosylase SLT domain-containing protein [Fibrobacter sp.]
MSQHQRCFVEILTPDGNNPKFELVNQRNTFGRHSSCTVQIGLDDLRVSNRHAEIVIDGTQVFIEDLNSTNHVFVNNEQVIKTEIKHNDFIRFGAQGPQLCLIIEDHQPVNDLSPHYPEQETHASNKNAVTYTVPPEFRADALHDSILFSVEPESEDFDLDDLVPEDTVRHEPVNIPDDNSLSIAHLKSETKNSVVTIPDHTSHISNSHPVEDKSDQTEQTTDFLQSDHSEVQKEISEDFDLFDVSPETDNRYHHESVADLTTGTMTDNTISDTAASNKPQDISIDAGLFDVSPDNECIKPDSSFNVNNTMEISSRLQKQIMRSQDLDILVKNPRTREKILNNKNIPEHQKQVIVSVTDTYTTMKRKYLKVFGIVIALLLISIVWFATGYFSYKHQLSKARSLKNQVASFDQLIEKARMQDDNDNSKLAVLYGKLQKVQQQFDSVKVKLELKDQQKIYSDTVEVFLDEIMAELNEKNYSIPQHMLERVKYYITLFTTDKRRSTEVLLKRRKVFFPEIETIFKQKSVPVILGYVAMQESLLDTNAKSSAGAVGMWQFIESTGIRFDLVINDTVDERLDWRKSTVAAADYFRSLLLRFGDGRGALLAMAAYNAGEEKISKALTTAVEDPIRDRDFWYLYRTSSILATETREYVPQVLARMIIDRNPQLYGF